MSVSLSPDQVNVLDSDTQRLGFLFRLDTDPTPTRFWLGVGDCPVAANAFDATGATYSGLGQLLDLPVLQQLINGVADRVSINASGVSADVAILASAESDTIKNRAVNIGLLIFGPDWAQLGPPIWLWSGFADFVTLDQSADTSKGGFIRTIGLSIGSLFTGRRRRGLSYLTDQDQQLRHPGDKFCERTALYSEFTKVWPTFP